MCQHPDQPTGFRRWIAFSPSYDCIVRQPCVHGSETCTPGSMHSHGRHSVDMTWYLQGEIGVVQFKVATGWMLDDTPVSAWGLTMAFDLGYHSPVPLYEGQSPMSDCHLLPGRECFYDGSGLMADTPWRLLRREGDAAVWKHLEDYYADTFSGVALPAEVSR